MKAQDQVLGTYELLEAVLHALPTRDLLLSQIVCRDWRKMIKRSQMLQRALFISEAGGLWRGKLQYDASLPNGTKGRCYRRSTTRVRVYRNELLLPLYKILGEHTKGKVEDRLPESWKCPEASWRGMLLSQPATDAKISFMDAGSTSKVGVAIRGKDLPIPIKGCLWYGETKGLRIEGFEDWEELREHRVLEDVPVEVRELGG